MISLGSIIFPFLSLCCTFFEIMFTGKFSIYGLKMTASSSQICILSGLYTTGKKKTIFLPAFLAKVLMHFMCSHWLTRLSLKQSF